jgi:GNAT superfamily N-acetyltransferase
VIRMATSGDASRVVDMAARFLSESEYRDTVAWNRPALETTFSRLVESDAAAVLVAEQDGGLVGMIALTLYDHPFSGERTASELAWWVEPEARKSGAGMRLLAAGETWAKHHGAKALQMIAPNVPIASLYERVGFKELETWFQRRL